MKGNTKQKQKNIKRVLSEIRMRGPISKRELQAITGFSWGSISSITTELEALGFIAFSGKQKTTYGRKPDEFDININDNYIIGVDFNSEGVLAVLCDLRGRQLTERFEPITERTRDTAESTLYNVIQAVLNEGAGKTISHIALAVQGDVDTQKGISVANKCIEDWNNVPLRDNVEQRFGKKTILLHDPDCLLYTERFFGHLRDSELKNAILLRIDHGVGLATMLQGKVYMGVDGKTCEIGTTVVPQENGWNYLHAVASESFVAKKYNELSGGRYSCKDIALLAAAGEKEALDVFARIGTALGFAINNAASILNPQRVILFGDFCRYSELFLNKSKETLKNLMGIQAPEIFMSKLTNEAAAVGAALFAADMVIDELIFVD